MNVGPLEIIILIVLVLLVFGAKRLPELGGALGQSIRGFGKGIRGESDEERTPVEAAKAPDERPPAEAPNEEREGRVPSERRHG